MKKLIVLLLCAFSIIGIKAQEKAKPKVEKKTEKAKPAKELKDCGEYNGHKLYKGAKGGCYYKDRSPKTKKLNKVYVEGNLCNC
jgi:hypothetical protein